MSLPQLHYENNSIVSSTSPLSKLKTIKTEGSLQWHEVRVKLDNLHVRNRCMYIYVSYIYIGIRRNARAEGHMTFLQSFHIPLWNIRAALAVHRILLQPATLSQAANFTGDTQGSSPNGEPIREGSVNFDGTSSQFQALHSSNKNQIHWG